MPVQIVPQVLAQPMRPRESPERSMHPGRGLRERTSGANSGTNRSPGGPVRDVPQSMSSLGPGSKSCACVVERLRPALESALDRAQARLKTPG
ncbi:MAG: hypothetical protein WEA10_09435 [Actinomycetota bacterium]